MARAVSSRHSLHDVSPGGAVVIIENSIITCDRPILPPLDHIGFWGGSFEMHDTIRVINP